MSVEHQWFALCVCMATTSTDSTVIRKFMTISMQATASGQALTCDVIVM
jgi:hypothetical protein